MNVHESKPKQQSITAPVCVRKKLSWSIYAILVSTLRFLSFFNIAKLGKCHDFQMTQQCTVFLTLYLIIIVFCHLHDVIYNN